VYSLLRAIAGIALRWYYRDIQVEGRERIPRQRPLLLVVNHPNALVDALLVGWAVPRRVLVTAKSTLFANPFANVLLRVLGVVPLFRASDAVPSERLDPARNRDSFRAVHDALRRGGTVLIFPEGKTHDEPSLAPLKTGAARIAIAAQDAGDVQDLTIVPIGLTFERKDVPRTRVLVQIGEPIVMRRWTAQPGISPAESLTTEIDARLRAVTLNYASIDDAARAIRLSSIIAALFDDVRPIGRVDRGLAVETAIARRIDVISTRLGLADGAQRAQADRFIHRLDAVQRVASKHGVLLEDVDITLNRRPAVGFTLREGWLLVIGGPFAVWGRINHWFPFRAARAVAMRSVDSAADPAMRTIVAATVFVAAAYLAQSAVVAAIWGPVAGLLYLVSLPIAADVNFSLSDRFRRAVLRARAYVRFRRDPGLQARLSAELESLRQELLAFDRALGDRELAAPVLS
jgi:glycerol-3-phosphate O-acyltransferase / dihydroxyacetone phosphate acyltransferase